jgi:hypothetical protein
MLREFCRLNHVPKALITRSDPAACVAIEPESWLAFAILSGLPSDALTGEQALVDHVVRDIATHPIAANTAGGHAHHH